MKVYEVKLEKVVSNHGYLGVDKLDGFTLDLPSVGSTFKVFLDPESFGVEYVETTPVESVEHIGNEYHIHTANSRYHVTVLRHSEEC